MEMRIERHRESKRVEEAQPGGRGEREMRRERRK